MSDMKEIIFEDINDDYEYGKYGGFEVMFDKKTGYINATKLCKDGGKEFSEWIKNNSSKNLLEEFSNCLRISKGDIINKKTNLPNHLKGTYVHPDLIPHIAMWISPKFGITISRIINEWRQLSHNNNVSYWTEMGDCIKNFPSKENDNEEHSWRDKIALEENGKIEVEVESGVIDVLTEFKIIEVKKVENWKHALDKYYHIHWIFI